MSVTYKPMWAGCIFTLSNFDAIIVMFIELCLMYTSHGNNDITVKLYIHTYI